MKTEIRKKRNELRKQSIKLRELTWTEDLDDDSINRLRKDQDKQYKKFMFYDNLIKAADNINKN